MKTSPTILSNQEGRGLFYYRSLALAAFTGNLVFALFFSFALSGGKEFYFDRMLIFVATLGVFLAGYRKGIQTKSYVHLVFAVLYLCTAQVMMTVINNQFNGFYCLSLFITIQAFSFSFRDSRALLLYMLFIFFALEVGLFSMVDLPKDEIVLFASLILVVVVLQYFAARVKTRIMHRMRVSQDLLQSLFSKSENAIILTNIHGGIVDINFRAKELLGYSLDELQEKDFKFLRRNSLTDEELEQGLQELETRKFWTCESVLVKKNGDVFPARLSVSLIRSSLNQYLVYRVMDITAMKENENRIIEARDRAEEAVKAKGQFLAVMSHEIRTPLNGVIATVSMMQQTELSHEQEEYTSMIRKSSQSLLMLINDILDYSKMESGRMALDPIESSIQEIVFDVTDVLRSHAESKGLELIVDYDRLIPKTLVVDNLRLKQVLFNLVGNAIKFTDTGRVTVKCECEKINHAIATVRFTIQDTGVGIALDKQHLLFQSFSQLDSSTSRKYGGTGLGLAISKQIIELMGGYINVHSLPGEGTSFTFSVTCEQVNSDVVAKANNLPAELVDIDYTSLKVLVAEDNEINQQVLRFIMESLGINATIVRDGFQAVKALYIEDYDMVFMDMQMPVMDGLEATRQIRSNSQQIQPVIIAISANSYEEDRQKCFHAGMDDFLAKPFELYQFKETIARWYKKKRNSNSNRQPDGGAHLYI